MTFAGSTVNSKPLLIVKSFLPDCCAALSLMHISDIFSSFFLTLSLFVWRKQCHWSSFSGIKDNHNIFLSWANQPKHLVWGITWFKYISKAPPRICQLFDYRNFCRSSWHTNMLVSYHDADKAYNGLRISHHNFGFHWNSRGIHL